MLQLEGKTELSLSKVLIVFKNQTEVQLLLPEEQVFLMKSNWMDYHNQLATIYKAMALDCVAVDLMPSRNLSNLIASIKRFEYLIDFETVKTIKIMEPESYGLSINK